ncbi:hypothetical protein [Maridesulfovibrio sp.]|uniref:hypothetical protein n=1 Tax=Maridesulfovibrio sp. TaxID=2795000 RepID=UPI002AA6DA12|nr:hypothetical protein [Maridesulfovibrio sp.]
MDSYFDIDRHQMPVHKVKPNEIEKFRYFREFLKRSERYKKLCDLVNETKRTAPFENELIRSWCCYGNDLGKPYRDWVWENISEEVREQPYNQEMSIDEALETVYGLFQDVFNDPFEDVIHRVKLFYEFYEIRGVYGVRESVMDLIGTAQRHNGKQGQLVDTWEVQSNISRYLDATQEGDGYCWNPLQTAFIINPHVSKEVILKDFKHVLDRVHVGPEGRASQGTKPFFTTGQIQLKFYQKCLDAYDALASAENKDKAVEKMMETNKENDGKYDSHVRTFNKLIRAAERFIEDAESGVFPKSLSESKKPRFRKKSARKQSEYSKIEHIVKRKWAEKMLSRMGPPKEILDAHNSEFKN